MWYSFIKTSISHILGGSLVGTTLYFLASNFLVWLSGTGINNLHSAKSWAGIIECYTVALPFYLNSIYATVLFCAILFGAYALITKQSAKQSIA